MEQDPQKKSLMALLFKAMISIGFCSFILHRIDLGQVTGVMKGMQVIPFLLATACLGCSVLIAARRWQVLLHLHGRELSFRNLNRIVWIGFFLNQGLPSSIGGDVYRVYVLSRHLNSTAVSLMSVFIERLYGFFSFAIIASFAMLIQFRQFPHASLWKAGWIALMMTGVAVGGLVVLRALPPTLIDRFDTRRFLKFLCQGVRALRALNLGYSGSFRVFSWTLLSHAMNLACFVILAQGLSLSSFGWGVALIVVPIVHIFGSLPISFAGWGLREGIMVYALSFFGIEAVSALSLSVLYGLSQLLLAGFGLGFWLSSGKREPFLKQNAISFNIGAR